MSGAPDVIELARDLVRAPSPNPPGDERAVAELLAVAIVAAGLPAATVSAAAEHRPNLRCTIDFGPGGRHVVLAGHTDTKPVGDAQWTVDPFAADCDGDRLYGLGSADMKSALAAMVVAAGRLADGETDLRAGRLTLLFTADEEDGARYGAQHVVGHEPLDADAIVIGEPGGIDADFDRLHLVSRGIARTRVVARARQGHSSLAGVPGTRNAGADVARAVASLADDPPVTAPDDRHGLSGWEPTLNAGLAFRGGVGYGVLPDRVAADTEVRLLPGMTREQVDGELRERVAAVAVASGADLALEWDAAPHDWLVPTIADPDGPLAAAARTACRDVLGHVPPDAVFPGTTDASFLGADGTPTLPALGPGLLRRCHAADEWVSITAVRQAVDLYVRLASELCRG